MFMAVASDIEGTLTTAETWKALARYLRESGRAAEYNTFFYARFPKALLARAGFIHKRNFQNQWIKELIGLFAGYSVDDFASIAEWVVENELWPKRRQDVVNAFLAHQKTGEALWIASGTYQPIAEAFARRLEAKAIGTRLELSNTTLTGRILNEVNVATHKAKALQNVLSSDTLYSAYGDSEADIPMLQLSTKPVAVYPDKVMRQTAIKFGWEILGGSSA
jgi:HAD superfamily phosphoserine phosphatase-like hydrolase